MTGDLTRSFGRFNLLRVLGRIGSMTTYQAHDKSKNQNVVLKVIWGVTSLTEPEWDSFEASFSEIQRLQHPNILAPEEMGRESDGVWIAIPSISQNSLRDGLGNGINLSLEEVLVVTKQISAALDYSHSANVFHGNLHANNVFIQDDLTVILTDFSVHLGMELGEPAFVPFYASPESSGGKPPSAASDLYAFASLVYLLLTNKQPFVVSTNFATIEIQLRKLPTLPSEENPQLPKACDSVMLQALASDPSQRYTSAGQFYEALEECLASIKTEDKSLPSQSTGMFSRAKASKPVTEIDSTHSDDPKELSDVYCPRCGNANVSSDKFCAQCWGPLRTGMSFTKEEAEKKVKYLNRARVQRQIIKSILSLGVIVGILLFFTQPYWLNRIPTATSSLSPDSGSDNWVMHGRDTSNSANALQFENIRGDLVWQFDTKKPFLSSPAVADGVVYVTTGDSRVLALNSSDGQLIWEQNVSGPVNASPLILQDNLYIGLRDGRILALSLKNGGINWSFQTSNPVMGSVVGFDGIVYSGSADGYVYALDAMTGEEIWSFDTEDWINTTPAMINDKLVVGNRAGNVFVLDLKTGKKSLRYHSGKVSDSIIAGDGRVYIPTSCTHSVSRGCVGGIRALDPSEREYPLEYFARFWRTHFYIWGIEDSPPVQKGYLWGKSLVGRSKAMFSPAYADGVIYAYGGHGNLVAMNPESGEINWTYESGKSGYSSPAIGNDMIYIGTNDGEIHIVNTSSGHQHQVLSTGGSITGQLVLAEGRLYAASRDGSLYVFE